MNYLGLDIGGTAIKIGLIDPQGNILCSTSFPAAFDNYQTPLMETALQGIQLFLSENHLSSAGIHGIGVSATGQIDSTTGTVVGTTGYIPHWIDTPVQEIMQKKYGLPVRVINDANSVALAEQWIGAAAGFSDVIAVTIGTGVGGGVIIHSDLLTGSRGIAGELGHFPIQVNGTVCSCGNSGCYEYYASTTALIRMVREQYDSLTLAIPALEIDGRFIFRMAQSGHAGICHILDEWIGYVAAGLIGLTHIFNPQLILIGGGVCLQDMLFISPLREKVLQHVMPQFSKGLQLKAASLGNNAGMIGAVRYFMQTEAVGKY